MIMTDCSPCGVVARKDIPTSTSIPSNIERGTVCTSSSARSPYAFSGFTETLKLSSFDLPISASSSPSIKKRRPSSTTSGDFPSEESSVVPSSVDTV